MIAHIYKAYWIDLYWAGPDHNFNSTLPPCEWHLALEGFPGRLPGRILECRVRIRIAVCLNMQKLLSRYWALKEQILGVAAPMERSQEDLDPPTIFHINQVVLKSCRMMKIATHHIWDFFSFKSETFSLSNLKLSSAGLWHDPLLHPNHPAVPVCCKALRHFRPHRTFAQVREYWRNFLPAKILRKVLQKAILKKILLEGATSPDQRKPGQLWQRC